MSPEIDIAMRASGPGRTDPPAPSLTEQAEGMDRPDTMREIVGPVLTDLLKSVYDTKLSQAEAQALKLPYSEIRSLENTFNPLFNRVLRILKTRFDETIRANPEESDAVRELNIDRPELFFFTRENDDRIFYEGIETSVAAPLTVALQIHDLENLSDSSSYKAHESDLNLEGIDFDGLIEIMERESFDEILLRLTKGPNGFLGGSSSTFSPNRAFFEFGDPDTADQFYSICYRDALKTKDAYEVKDGKVVGLAETYHIAAHTKRKAIVGDKSHKRSSGCPVRHSFPDPETGEPQEPLVITAKKFLIAAMRASQGQPEQEAA